MDTQTLIATGLTADQAERLRELLREGRGAPITLPNLLGWIPVTAYLPARGQRVLASASWEDGEFVTAARFLSEDEWEIEEGRRLPRRVTAWMPLPGPYREG